MAVCLFAQFNHEKINDKGAANVRDLCCVKLMGLMKLMRSKSVLEETNRTQDSLLNEKDRVWLL